MIRRLSPSVEADAEHLLLSRDCVEAQRGMAVESVEAGRGSVTVATTGAFFAFQPDAGVLQVRQRLGMERSALRIRFPPKAMDHLRVEARHPGAVLLSSAHGRLRMRINGDSLLMLRDEQPLALTGAIEFSPRFVRRYQGHSMFHDEYGCVGFYPASGPQPAAALTDPSALRYELSASQVFWISIAPPRPYPWEHSFRDRVIWHWSKETGYPADAQIQEWSSRGNLLLQQSEVMLWKDWNLGFLPRDGIEEFRRVMRTCRRFGMRNLVYTSPFYFLTGTGLEAKAMNSYEGFTGYSPGDGRGLNWPLFVKEIRRVMREYRPSGLYFDGMYNNVVRTYLLARKARELVGDDGLLECHATLNEGACQHTPPGGGLYVPQIDACFDFVLRGEDQHREYGNDDFLRYSVSTYNISNSIGVLCDNMGYRLDSAMIDRLLELNIRLHYRAFGDEGHEALLASSYWPKLNDSLISRVEAGCARRTQA